jgi:hypothetical protein
MSESDTYIPFFEMGANVVDSAKGAVTLRFYPTDAFVDYTKHISPDMLATMMGIIIQFTIDHRPDAEQNHFIERFLTDLTTQIDNGLEYEKHDNI